MTISMPTIDRGFSQNTLQMPHSSRFSIKLL